MGLGRLIHGVQGFSSGKQGKTKIPFCDLLSTFTGLLTAHELGFAERVDSESCLRYVNQLERGEGGFRGAAWDDGADPEYAFYGLGALALLGIDRS